MAWNLDKANTIGHDEPSGCCRHHRRGWGHKGHGACAGGHRRARREECPLSEAIPGDIVKVIGIRGDEVFRGRIMAMGILPGVTLKVVGGGRGQPLVVALSGSRCVVDRRSSEMIAVRGARPHEQQERTGQ